jgi:hypothetical protein
MRACVSALPPPSAVIASAASFIPNSSAITDLCKSQNHRTHSSRFLHVHHRQHAPASRATLAQPQRERHDRSTRFAPLTRNTVASARPDRIQRPRRRLESKIT